MLKPNHYYWIRRSCTHQFLNNEFIILIDNTGNLERDLYFKYTTWNYLESEWLDITTELTDFEIVKEWSSKEEMLADMFLELM